MFLRFQARRRSLIVSLVRTQRSDGKVRQEHIAGLGSISLDQATVRERSRMWQALHTIVADRKLDDDQATKLMTALQARVPYPTPEEQGADELRQAEEDAALWLRLHGQTTGIIGARKGLIEHQQRLLADDEETAKQEEAKAEEAKAKAARLANYRGL